MTEIRIRVKDLISELNVAPKEMLRALRDLGLPSRSTAGSVDMPDAGRLRDYFDSRQAHSVETTEVQPNVIVRRRRKEAVESPAQEERKPEAQQQASEAMPEPKPERQRRPRKQQPSIGARVISRPGDTPPEPEPVAEEPVAPEPAHEPEVPQPPRKTLAEEIREADAAKKAAALKKDQELKATLARGATVIRHGKQEETSAKTSAEPAEAPKGQTVQQEQPEPPVEAPKAAPAEPARQPAATVARIQRVAMPDASAVPSGSSAPTLGQAGKQT
ncbi:MAG: hypothetical protein HDQ44_01145, partial [Desulfovibrio sp.]|nr:hypothetical protein [Desulfovibrio sp.]